MFAALGRFTYRRRRVIAAAWLVVFVLGIAIGGQTFARVKAEMNGSSDAESMLANERLNDLGTRSPAVLGVIDGIDVHDRTTERAVRKAAADIAALEAVSHVADHYTAGSHALVAEDGRATMVAVYLEQGISASDQHRAAHTIKERLQEIEIGRVLVGGDSLLNEEIHVQSEKDLQRGEMVSLPIVLLVLVIIFGGIVGAGLPLIVALMSVAGALLFLFGVTAITDVSVYAINVATMLGLGLAVDYSLLVISRFREQRGSGVDIAAAVEAAVGTAGVTVAFSGLTVAAALTGLLFFDDPGMKSLTYGGIGVVIAAIAASITLLPALLGMWGKRIKVKNRSTSERGVFFRLSKFVQRRAVAIVTVVSVGLLLLATPFLGVEFASPGVEALPRSSESRQVFEVLRDRFPSHGADPVTVVAETTPSDPAVSAFVTQVEALPGSQAVGMRDDISDAVVIDVLPVGSSQGPVARRLAEEIRGIKTPFTKLVGGPAAFLVDYQDSIKDRLPYALATIAIATFVLLFLMTGSVVVPLKAIVMNLLSLGASFGVLIWGFQDGHLAGILNFEPTGSVDLWIPIIVFVFAFGLSMDYEVFLLSRIKEEYERSGDNDHSVAVGLQKTGGIVTSAAILIVTVFLGFAAGELVTIKMLGIGMALAIIVDASIVRMLLVPATMRLMGDRNWWAPRLLREFHARFGLHEPVEPWPLTSEAVTIEAA